MLRSGCALEHCLALGHLDQAEVQGLCNGCKGQFTRQHGLHGLQTVLAFELRCLRHTCARARPQT